jgi:lipoprotein-anchoring transpeptidase ErfK/SrfK
MVTRSRRGRAAHVAVALLAAATVTGCGAGVRANYSAPTAPSAVPTPTATPSPAVSVPAPAVVARALRSLTVYRSAAAPRPYERLSKRTPFDSPRVMLVTAQKNGWVQTLLPQRPNGSRGWVPLSQVQLSTVPYRVVVSLRTHRATVFRGATRLFMTKVANGKASTPTARGTFYVTDVLPVPGYQPWYGPYALPLSGYSPVYQTFDGGDAELAMHGTDQPELLGTAASHGCVRMSNAAIKRLAHLLPLGTPVTIG